MRLIERHRKAAIWAGGLTLFALAASITLHFLPPEAPALLVWFIAVNVVAAGAFIYDKQASRRNDPGRRIPELALLWMCLIGGSVGGIVVMLGRRHKTIDPQFRFVLGIIVGIQIGAFLFWLWSRLTGAS
ncbi:MAG: DUF1294 domain-containing protein [Phycisphaerales bacterium]|nr:DUF1294 domain-containing protein [Phycisphaerales bacterium]